MMRPFVLLCGRPTMPMDGNNMPRVSTFSTRSSRSSRTAKSHCGTSTSVPILSLIHISEPTRLGMISYAVFCLKKKKKKKKKTKEKWKKKKKKKERKKNKKEK